MRSSKSEAKSRDVALSIYLFSGLLDLTGRLERTFVLPFSASIAAIRVSALSPSADRRALWVALRWLVRRFVSFALFVPRIWSSIAFAKVFNLHRWQNELKEAPLMR